MDSHSQFEITGLMSGQALSNEASQENQQFAIGLYPELGLVAFACDPASSDQTTAKKALEILNDDMDFNLAANQHITPQIVARCLHESIENINDFLIEQNQINENFINAKGLSLAVVQFDEQGFSSSMHGEVAGLQISEGEAIVLSSKICAVKSLGINPDLDFSINTASYVDGDVFFLSTSNLVTQLGIEFIRLTLSRFGSNLAMAVRQIQSRVSQKQITADESFIICRRYFLAQPKKTWFS